jgi:methionyl aminopeptidase
MQPGMLLAVEPMLALGTSETRSKGREWPIFTADGSLAVHYEADVMIDEEEGPVNLTEGLELMPDIVG